MRLFGREIRWRELETRALEQVEYSDIGIAFAETQAELVGARDTTLPAVYRAAQISTDLPASLPLESVDSFGVASPASSPLLEQPNPLETYNQTMRKLFASLVFRGNAYLAPFKYSATGVIEGVRVLNPDEVSVAWDRLQLNPVYSWRDKPLTVWEEIFPVAINLWPGALRGVGPLEAARLMFVGMKAEARTARNLFADDATPGGALKVPRPLTKEEAEDVREMWEASHGGRKRPAVLSGGVEFEPLTFSPLDAQFIEQRNFSIQETARLFGMPGNFLLVSSGESMTYATTEGLMRQYLTTTLNPTYLEPVEQVFTMMLPAGERARFRTLELLRADTEARYRAHQVGLAAGFLTEDEVRQTEGLPPLETPRAPARQPLESEST